MSFRFSPDQVSAFQREGYVLVQRLFDADEIRILQTALENDPSMASEGLQRQDGEGGVTKLRVWNQAGDDPFGLVGRLPRIVEPMEQVLGDEVYLYHAKATIKEPYTGGAWAWHQDYGYWYNNGCLYPDMASCMIAVDACTRENGCLQVLTGSHLLGRIDHGKVGDQTGADPARLEEIKKICPLVYAVMAPGDALFFHGNTLHRSDQNHSPLWRRTFICCYNTKRNNPYKTHHHPCYTPIQRVPDHALRGYANSPW